MYIPTKKAGIFIANKKKPTSKTPPRKAKAKAPPNQKNISNTIQRIKDVVMVIAIIIGMVIGLWKTGIIPISSNSDHGTFTATKYSSTTNSSGEKSSATAVTLEEIERWRGQDYPYAEINNNTPFFSNEELVQAKKSYQTFSDLDALGRCGAATASVGKDIMPTAERGDISEVHPSGWQSNCGWQRCHLIGYQLTGQNSNDRNLVTGTQYMNVPGMLPFENEIADYVEGTGNHVLYKVTPMFKGNELVCRGVLMEAQSIEDNGRGVQFNVFCYNVQPGKTINYATGYVSEAR